MSDKKYDEQSVRDAFETIRMAMIADSPEEPGSYAHSWHCNLAICFYDELMTNSSNDADVICNAAASRFMSQVFGVATSK